MNKDKSDVLFKQLDLVNWRDIYDINGRIDYNIRDILKELISDNKKVRDTAYWKLDNHIVVQSALSESCLFILPFLNELLKNIEFKDRLLDIIFEIINGIDLTLNGFVNVNYSTVYEPFIYFKKDEIAKPRRLKNCISEYLEENVGLYCGLLSSTTNLKELETLLYILLCFNPSSQIKQSFYSAKNNQINPQIIEVYNDFIQDIEEVHGENY